MDSTNCGWEFKDTEGRLYALFYAVLYKGREHLRIFISAKVLEPIPHGYGGTITVRFLRC